VTSGNPAIGDERRWPGRARSEPGDALALANGALLILRVIPVCLEGGPRRAQQTSLRTLRLRAPCPRGRQMLVGTALEMRKTTSMGLVSRVSPVQTALRNCTRDEGRSFEVGNRVLISNHRRLVRQSHACNPHGAIIALQHPDTALVWLGSKRESACLSLMSALASYGHACAGAYVKQAP
jgi:hypothetical protein